jgi:hypothetical protein
MGPFALKYTKTYQQQVPNPPPKIIKNLVGPDEQA